MTPRAAALVLIPLGAAALSGCGAFGPYATVPSPATPRQVDAPRVAICYNALRTSRAVAREAAQKECPAGTIAELLDTDYILEYCPLLLPAHATFACTSEKK